MFTGLSKKQSVHWFVEKAECSQVCRWLSRVGLVFSEIDDTEIYSNGYLNDGSRLLFRFVSEIKTIKNLIKRLHSNYLSK